MKYIVIKNVPIIDLIERKPGGGIQWEKYGLCPIQIRRYGTLELVQQGNVSYDAVANKMSGDHVSIFPIKKEEILNSKMDNLQNKIDTNGIEGDSIHIYEEEDQDLLDLRAAIKTASEAYNSVNG